MSLSNELRAVIEGRLKAAGPREILSIASALCAQENGAAAQPESVKAADAGPRFVGNTSDTVYDRSTGLLWTKGNVGEKPMNWTDAKKAVAALNLAGYTDWRLPTIRELLTLVDYDRKDPAIDPVFKCDSIWYWTSTVAAASPSGLAWIVYFDGGGSNWDHQLNEFHFRAVRAGQIVGSALA